MRSVPTVGVLALQGDVREHVRALSVCGAAARTVRRADELDSVDALQLVVALDKNFGLKIPDPAAAKEILQNVGTIVKAVQNRIGAGEA